jgi:ParB family chromosome partitioning protein
MDEIKTLFNLDTNNISANPHNPRMIFDPVELDELKQSIEKVGILVPVTVYKNKKSFPDTEYILLDGERRWRCAKMVGLKTIPANIIEEPADLVQNILYMFNIHYYRQEWPLFPTALKLQVIMKELNINSDNVLSKSTGLTKTTIRRCKILLWYPEKYRDILTVKGGKISTDFFIELYPVAYRLSFEPEFDFPEGTEKFVDTMIDKFSNTQVISDVKEFREIRKSLAYHEKANTFNEFKNQIVKFVDDKNTSLEIFASPEIENEKTRINLLKYIGYINTNMTENNLESYSDYYFVEQLRLLKKTVDLALEKLEV